MITRNKKYIPMFVHAMFTAFLGLVSVALVALTVVLPPGPPEAIAGLTALLSSLGTMVLCALLCDDAWKRLCKWAEEEEQK